MAFFIAAIRMVSSVTVGRLKPGTNMKLKTVEINGKQYAEIDTAGLPVYVHDDGKEIGFDAPLAIKKITELNGEAKNHRLAKEAAEEKLAKFAAIEDPKKAIEALEMLSKIDQKKLIDAGQVDQVKAEITKNFQQQLDEEKQRSQMLETQLYDSMIGGSFAGSKYIADKIAIPADLLQARFGQAFKVEEGKIVAYDASGNKIYSRAKPGELAQFDEALEFLVENYPQKDYILKASGNNGGGSRPTQHDIGQKTMKRSAFDALDVAGKQNALKDGTDTLGMVTSFSYAGDKNRQLTHYSDTRWHEDSVRNRWFSVMAGPSVRVNEWFSAYAMAGVAYSRVSTFSGDYLRVTDNKGKTHDVLTGSDDGRHSNTSLAWGAGVQFNPIESVAIDIAYEGSGSGDWRTDGFIVGDRNANNANCAKRY